MQAGDLFEQAIRELRRTEVGIRRGVPAGGQRVARRHRGGPRPWWSGLRHAGLPRHPQAPAGGRRACTRWRSTTTCSATSTRNWGTAVGVDRPRRIARGRCVPWRTNNPTAATPGCGPGRHGVPEVPPFPFGLASSLHLPRNSSGGTARIPPPAAPTRWSRWVGCGRPPGCGTRSGPPRPAVASPTCPRAVRPATPVAARWTITSSRSSARYREHLKEVQGAATGPFAAEVPLPPARRPGKSDPAENVAALRAASPATAQYMRQPPPTTVSARGPDHTMRWRWCRPSATPGGRRRGRSRVRRTGQAARRHLGHQDGRAFHFAHGELSQ